MRILSSIKDQLGYTLLETVVSMALFVSVLIPLGATVGKLMLSDNSDLIHLALQVAETEMCSTIPQNEVEGRTNSVSDGFAVAKEVTISGSLVTVKVAVASVKKPEKNVVALQKTFLVYR